MTTTTESQHQTPEVPRSRMLSALGIERTILALIVGLIAMVFLFLTVLGQDPLPVTPESETDSTATESQGEESPGGESILSDFSPQDTGN